jgi:hypothetical protein
MPTLAYVNIPYTAAEVARMHTDLRVHGYCVLPDVYERESVTAFDKILRCECCRCLPLEIVPTGETISNARHVLHGKYCIEMHYRRQYCGPSHRAARVRSAQPRPAQVHSSTCTATRLPRTTTSAGAQPSSLRSLQRPSAAQACKPQPDGAELTAGGLGWHQVATERLP